MTAAAAGLPPGCFALSMASGIVSIGFEPVVDAISIAALAVAVTGFVVHGALLTVRALHFRDRLAADLANPRRTFGFFTFVAAAGVLAGRLEDAGARGVALALAALGAVAWIALTYAIPPVLVATDRDVRLADVDGGWLLWVVATESVAVTAAQLGGDITRAGGALGATAVCLWAVGAVLYVAIITLVLARLLLAPLERDELTPVYWITMGATAITVLAGGRILGIGAAIPVLTAARPAVEGISLVLWAFGSWWVPLLLVLGVWRYRGAPAPRYDPALWSAVFPLGMYGTASRTFGDVTGIGGIAAIGRAELWVALAAWTLLLAALGLSARAALTPLGLRRAERRNPLS